ncbi:hypothetical protein [Candidatus Chlorohelix sp.]|uniref:DUF4346 domain-containing protein n=1 Tax=Candidatus Chlorohelix sp. TaxID=3139201 RepID=UPI0030479DC5
MSKLSDIYWKTREKSGIMWRRSVGRVVDWPPSPGRFVVGNAESAVAVCTLSSTALIDQLNPHYAAIIGRVYTPNLGIERMIINVVSNPRLRYLVLCGRESPVFKVGEATIKIFENGLDEHGKIIGASGAMAELPNLSPEMLETFRNQFKLINLIDEVNPKKVDKVLAEYFALNAPPYAPQGLFVRPDNENSYITMQAHRRQWLEFDPSGYFFIHIDWEQHELALERYTTDKRLTHVIRGRAADVLYHTVIAEKLLSQMEHAAYLGAELAKAETALYNGLNYEQDKKIRVADRASAAERLEDGGNQSS